ncbi:MAG: glycosyltransferase family 39 protein [Bacteroidales bacterium]|nr:glycosyltransferase family 39 protein [Bacteroidales bacterium]
MNIITYFRAYYTQKPLQCILFVALLLRLVAAIFAKGYGMHDDHFLIIETSGSFAEGFDYNNWLPGSSGNETPKGHSFFYMGLHYILFMVLNTFGMVSPDVKMYIVRIIHAVYSLSIVYFGYKIVTKYAGKQTGLQTAWLLAVLWFMPWLCVRNLVEIQCVPFLLWGIWLYIKKDNPTIKMIILSGLIAGIAFSIRFQAAFILGGFGLSLLCLKQFKNAIIWGISTLSSMLFIQACIDFFIWGIPCVELIEYVRYNFISANDYLKGSPLMYVYMILGLFIPPVSIFILWGFFARWRKYLILFLPSFIFLLFHSLFINKQERFVLTIIPMVLILGMIGWKEFMDIHLRSNWQKNFVKWSWKFCLTINLILLCFVSVHYSKKARVEAMLYLSKYKQIEHLAKISDIPMLPMFYLGQFVSRLEIDKDQISSSATILKETAREPRFILLTDNRETPQIIDSLKLYFPDLVFEIKIKPSMIDHLMHLLNPEHNRNQTLLIYRNQKYFPVKR